MVIERANRETTTARMIAALDGYERAQSDLERDAIKLRGGLLHDYDPLVVDVAQFEAASRRLLFLSASSPSLQRQARVLADAASVQGRLTEQLKSDSALMLNSLAYFSRLSAPAAGEPAAAPDVAALAATMLRLTLDASLENQAEVARRIQSVSRHEAVASVDPLFNHARLLLRLLPATDRTVENLLAADAAADRHSLRATLQRDLAAEQSEAMVVRVGLLLVSLLLAAVLLDLGRRLRDHVRALGRRAELERTVAEISASLIRAQLHQVRPAVIKGLSRLARGIGADRAYLIGEGSCANDLRWARPEAPYGAGWPRLALDLAASISHEQKGSFHVTVAEAPTILRTAGARSVAAAWATTEEGARVLLGMDASNGRLRLDGDEIEVIRLGLDVLAGAVRRSALEHERAHLEQRLEEASRMEALGAFASGIAHNFNNILAAIGGYAEMAAASVRSASPPARQLSEIQLAVARGRDLIDRILAFGRRSSAPAWREVDVRMALEEAASLLRAAHLDASIGVKDVGAGVVNADPGALQQILLNLGANAIQASGAAADVTLSASLERILRPRALVAGRVTDGDYVVLAVEDRGSGIAPEQVPRIFDPFVTTRADGHGLGLATVDALVRDHGGAIDVFSTPGQGSRFEIWLPREPAPGAPPPGRLADHGQGEALLLLCIDEQTLADAEDRLAELGYEPIGFSALPAAAAALAAAPERFDGAVVIADGSHATEWTAALRQAAVRLPLIVTSAPGQIAPAPGLVGPTVLAWPLDARALIHALNARVA
ncbi:MAG TPA: DAHL domain-containing protein [Caulobacteraceae bacterium]|jgi:signal transduction histidine kinase|nr:DAHL domain-containing protein [Caulobacteraceae bacterium]